MKKIKFASFLLASGLLFNSCQNEEYDQSVVDSIVQPAELSGEKIQGSYIIVLKQDKFNYPINDVANVTYSTREEKSDAYKRMSAETITSITNNLASVEFDQSKITNFSRRFSYL